ncbi:MAG: ATP-binding protein [Sphingomonadales bacterium]
MARRSSLTVRLVASAGLWTVGSLMIGFVLLSVLFRHSVERAFDARLSVILENLIAVTEADGTGELRLRQPLVEPRFSQPYSGWYWQVTPRNGVALRSRSLWDQTMKPDLTEFDRFEHRYYSAGPDQQSVRIIERDITLPGATEPFRFAIAAETSDISRETAAFDRALLWSLGGLGISLTLAALVQIRFGLRPLRKIRSSLAGVRSGETQRLDDDFPTEIMPLVAELNALLDHNAEVLERARTHVGNLAHALKTPLSVLANEARDAEGTRSELLERQITFMRRHVDHYLTRARTGGAGTVIGTRTEAVPVVEDLRRALTRIHVERGIACQINTPHEARGLVFAGERQDLDEMLGNLMDNAFKWAAERVEVTLARTANSLIITVDDDGPGIAEEQRDAVFARGNRFDSAVPGSGLGLAIVRDIAALCGGQIRLQDSPLGGLRAELTLPAAQ